MKMSKISGYATVLASIFDLEISSREGTKNRRFLYNFVQKTNAWRNWATLMAFSSDQLDHDDDDIYLKDSPTGTKPWSRGSP